MKLATYQNLSPGATGDRLGAVLNDGRMLDLRLAYASYLVEKEGEGRPYAMAKRGSGICAISLRGEPAMAAAARRSAPRDDIASAESLRAGGDSPP